MLQRPATVLGAAFAVGTLFAQVQPGTVLWSFDAGGLIRSSPALALALDGTIYFGASGTLYAITNMGSNKWVFTTQGYEDSSPAIGVDGTVYYPSIRTGNSDSGFLYAVNPDGSQKWAYPSQGGNGSPAIGRDNTIYIQGYAYLHAVSPEGTNKWKVLIDAGSSFLGSPAIGGDRTIYIASLRYNVFHALNTDGSEKWTADLYSTPADSSTIGADGTIYVTGGWLYAFSPTGSNAWVNQLYFGAFCPAIGRDGTLYVGTSGGSLDAISPTGVKMWQVGTNHYGAPPYRTPAIASDGTIYYTGFNTLYAISPAGTVRWTFNAPGSIEDSSSYSWTSPAIGPDGTIYATFGSRLYAFVGTNTLADTPWPMYRQNARHTGKVEKPVLKQPQKRADANFQFQLYGQIDQTQTVQTSTDLVTWAPLTNVVVTNVPMDVVDLGASNFPSRFYRTVTQ